MDRIAWPACDVCGQSIQWARGGLVLREDDLTEYWDVPIDQQRQRVPAPAKAKTSMHPAIRLHKLTT